MEIPGSPGGWKNIHGLYLLGYEFVLYLVIEAWF